MMGLGDLGQVKEGFVADLLILESNPLEGLEGLAHPESGV